MEKNIFRKILHVKKKIVPKKFFLLKIIWNIDRIDFEGVSKFEGGGLSGVDVKIANTCIFKDFSRNKNVWKIKTVPNTSFQEKHRFYI